MRGQQAADKQSALLWSSNRFLPRVQQAATLSGWFPGHPRILFDHNYRAAMLAMAAPRLRAPALRPLAAFQPEIASRAAASDASRIHAPGSAGRQEKEQQTQSTSQVHPVLQRTLRADLAAEEAAAALFRGQQQVLCDRPDATLLAEREQAHLEAVRRLAPAHRVRPSLLSPALRAGFFALGAAAGLAPRRLSAAIMGGMQDALEDVYTEQLRELRAEGLAGAAPDVRKTVIALRDEDRAVEGAPQAPDLLPYATGSRRLSELSLEEGVAGAVKVAAKLSLDLARRL